MKKQVFTGHAIHYTTTQFCLTFIVHAVEISFASQKRDKMDLLEPLQRLFTKIQMEPQTIFSLILHIYQSAHCTLITARRSLLPLTISYSN